MVSPLRRALAGYHPSLVNTLHMLLLGILLLLGLSTWLSMPLLSGIADKARQTRTVELPQITHWRHNAQRVELLYGYINTLYWIEDPQVARNTRLQAQVLIHGFGFTPGSELDREATRILNKIRELTRARRQQSQVLADIQAIGALHDSQPMVASLPDQFTSQAERFSASLGQLSLLGHDWERLLRQAEDLQSMVARHLPDHPQLMPHAEHLHSLYTGLQEILLLEREAKQSMERALEHQHRLAELLNSSAALRTQQLSDAMEADARQVQTYTLTLLSAFALFTCLMLLAFNYLVLRPVRRLNQALQQIGQGDSDKLALSPTLFSELNAIGHSVGQYGQLTLQLQRANTELEQLSQQDGLTGLANRRRFDTALVSEHDRARRHGHSLTLVLLDLDYFKQLNDRHGHLFGDDCLRQFATILKTFSQRAGDLAARYGGEEFALILPQLSFEESLAVVEQIRRRTAEHTLRSSEGVDVQFTLSAGLLFLADARQLSSGEMMRQVDQALYRAKAQGRNRIESVRVQTQPLQRSGAGS